MRSIDTLMAEGREKPVTPKKKRAAKVKASGVSVSICRYSITVDDGRGNARTWEGNTVAGFARDLAESARPLPARRRSSKP